MKRLCTLQILKSEKLQSVLVEQAPDASSKTVPGAALGSMI